jgi:lipid A disaccharide synthetase
VSEPSVAHLAQPSTSSEEQQEAQERFDATSKAYFLLVGSGREAELERVARIMDEHASKLRVL